MVRLAAVAPSRNGVWAGSVLHGRKPAWTWQTQQEDLAGSQVHV